MMLPNHSSSSSRKVCCSLLLSAALVAPGCQLAFGTYSGNVSQNTGGTAGAGGAATGGTVTYGGAASGGDTTGAGGAAGSGGCTAADCPKCAITDAPRCGETTDAGTPLLACEDPKAGFIQSDICSGDLRCQYGVNHCILCAINEAHCDPTTGTGKTCNDDQASWFPHVCYNDGCKPDAGAPDICDICANGTTHCSDPTTLRYCYEGKWQTKACGSSGCQEAVGPNPAQCID